MKHRHVYSVPTPLAAEAAVAAARASGIDPAQVALVARQDIELHVLPPDRIDPSTDTIPAAARGALQGGSIGLLAGLVASTIPALGLTVAGAALFAAIGTAVGGWSSALMGSALPNEVRRRFEDEIEQGRILVVLDGEKDELERADAALRKLGAEPLPFDKLSALS